MPSPPTQNPQSGRPPDAVEPRLDRTPVQDADALARSRQLSFSEADPPGDVPGYEVLQSLGEGSFGSVWLARELKTGKQVAIKFYTQRRGLDWSLLSREVEKLAVLYTSRNIVGLLDVGWDHDPPYFVMEYLESGSLEQRLHSGPLPVEVAVRFAKAIARALVHAHGSGILHCDLKPANVLLDANEEPRLGDFGQSRLTTEHSPAFGTVFYMAPEQALPNASPDARWDVYALGAVLYQMVTGSPPYRTPENEARLREATTLASRLEVYRQIVLNDPKPEGHRRNPGVDSRLAEIIDGCLARDPAERLSNPQQVLDLLEERDAVRSRRPLIALGFLGPILFLFAMYWIAEAAVPRIVETAEKNLIERALGSDEVSARILARAIQQDIGSRQAKFEQLARAPEFRELIERSQDLTTEALIDLCLELHEDDPASAAFRWMNTQAAAEQQHLSSEGRTPDHSWFVTDARGRQVYRYPPREPERNSTVGRMFHWRDYFHSQGRDLAPSTLEDETEPREVPGVSRAFLSQAAGQFLVAIAVPVRSEDGSEILGVAARTIPLTDLLHPWEVGLAGRADARNANAPSRFLVLADSRDGTMSLLDHPWMSQAQLLALAQQEPDERLTQLTVPAGQTERLEQAGSTDRYRDPIGKLDPRYDGEWLAASAPVGNTHWRAIVQERREVTLAPVDELRQVFVRAGVTALGIFGLLLGLLWYLIQRASA